MVNLRSRKIPEKSGEDVVEVETPRRRRASSAQPESTRGRTRRFSEKSEDLDAPSTPRSQRKSLRLNSPLVLSKMVRKDPFAEDSNEAKTRPSPILEEKGESPGKERVRKISEKSNPDNEDSKKRSIKSPVIILKDLVSKSSADESGDIEKSVSEHTKKGIIRSPVIILKDIVSKSTADDPGDREKPVSPNKEKRETLLKGKERKISDYFDSGKEQAKTNSDIVRLRDVYASNLSKIGLAEPASPTMERRGSLVKGSKKKISDFFESVKEDVKIDIGALGPEDDKSSKVSTSPNRDKSKSPVKGRDRKTSDKSESGQQDARTKIDVSPSRSAVKNDPKPGRRSPRRSSTPGSDLILTISGDEQEETEGIYSSYHKGNTPSPDKKVTERFSRKSSCGGETVIGKEDERTVVPSRSPRKSLKSKPEAVVQSPKEGLKLSRKKDKSSSPDKNSVRSISVTSFHVDDTPVVSSAISSKSPRDRELGLDRISAGIQSPKSDDSLVGSPKLLGNQKALPKKDDAGTPLATKSDVVPQVISPKVTKSNVPVKKRWNWNVSDFFLPQHPKSKVKSGSGKLRLSSKVHDSISDQKLKTPMITKSDVPEVKRMSLEKVSEPQEKDDENLAVKNDGRTQSSFKTLKSTDKKQKGSESGPESAGMLILSPKKGEGSPVQLKNSKSMDWEPSETHATVNEDTSVEMKDVSNTGDHSPSKTPGRSRRRRKSGSQLSPVSPKFLVSKFENGSSSSLEQKNDGSLMESCVVTDGIESQKSTPQETTDGTKGPNVSEEKKSKIDRKSGSEALQLLDDSNSKTKTLSSDKLLVPEISSVAENSTTKDVEICVCAVEEISDVTKSPKVSRKKRRLRKRRKSGSGQILDGSKSETEAVSGVQKTDGSASKEILDCKTEPASGNKVVPAKAARKKHKNKKKHDTQIMKAPEAFDEVRNKDYSMKMGDSEVTVRRRGGGTIIESRPVFSDDAKYIYVNCGWGVRVFSIETGECVRVFDAYSKDHKVVTCFCWKSCPAALTSEGVFIAWDPRSGKIQQKVRLNVQELVVGGFFFSVGPESILCLVLETKKVTELRVYSGTTFRSQQHPLNKRKIGHPYNLHRFSVGGNPERPFIAFISNKKKLKIVNMENKPFTKRVVAGVNNHWTCVQCHPVEDTVALGDSIGRIVVYRIARSGDRGTMEMIPSIYHWHTLPVCEIAFTPAGSSMYSGGGELTLVKWNLENPHIRNYLPRLSADIVHIAISPYNQMIAIATLDNGIQIVTPNNRLHCVLQQLSWSVFSGEQEGMFPSGLIYDPRSRGLMLNGRPGHLQLYSPLSETLTYNIDVTMMNYLTQERDKVIVNTHVTHQALTSDGLWLATIETRYEPGLALELKLKFWEYIVGKKRFILATVIDMPHDGKVHSIKFSPGPTGSMSNEDVGPDHEVVLASTGADKKLRLWAKTPIDSIYQKGNTWRCQNACFYKDRPCGPSSFSYDGSLLAVGFGSVLTLWDVENVVLKQTVTRNTDELKFVEFGRDDCCHILMCATETNIVAWNLLTLSLVWKVEMRTALFVPDPYSCFFAVFTSKNQWKIFDAHNGEIAYTMNSEGKSEVGNQSTKSQVLAAVFAPRHRPNPDAPKWMKNSYLYYIDIYQELNCLEPANEISQLPTFQLALDKDAGTPFGSLVGAKSVRETTDEELPKQAVGYGVLGSQAVTQLLRPPAHTLPPVSLLCGSFLQSFIIMKRDAPPSVSDHEDKSEDDKTTVVASSDSEGEAKISAKSGKSSRSRKHKVRRAQKNKKLGSGDKNGLDKKIVLDEPMETEVIDLRKHFPLLDEDDGEGVYVIDD